jgi:hypothetical protein
MKEIEGFATSEMSRSFRTFCYKYMLVAKSIFLSIYLDASMVKRTKIMLWYTKTIILLVKGLKATTRT